MKRALKDEEIIDRLLHVKCESSCRLNRRYALSLSQSHMRIFHRRHHQHLKAFFRTTSTNLGQVEFGKGTNRWRGWFQCYLYPNMEQLLVRVFGNISNGLRQVLETITKRICVRPTVVLMIRFHADFGKLFCLYCRFFLYRPYICEDLLKRSKCDNKI